MIKTINLIIFILFLPFALQAQDPIYASPLDTTLSANKIKVDTNKTPKIKKSFFKDDYPSPKKAALLAVIPGMGQIYNKKYWKLPIVYGALGGVIYSIRFNSIRYRGLVNSLEVRANVNCQSTTSQVLLIECKDQYAALPINAATSQRNSFDKNKQLSWIGVVAFYLMSAGDAFVDAHLKDFSVDDDISFRPMLETNYVNQPTIGLSVRIPLSK